MTFEDMVIAHDLIERLGSENVEPVLDLLEEGSCGGVPPSLRQALTAFARAVEHELGEGSPAAQQMRGLLSRIGDAP